MEIFPRDSEWEEGGRKEMKLNASTFTVLKIQCKSKGQRRARALLKKSKMAELARSYIETNYSAMDTRPEVLVQG